MQPVQVGFNFAHQAFRRGRIGNVRRAAGQHFRRMPGQRQHASPPFDEQSGDGPHGPQGMVDGQQGQGPPFFQPRPRPVPPPAGQGRAYARQGAEQGRHRQRHFKDMSAFRGNPVGRGGRAEMIRPGGGIRRAVQGAYRGVAEHAGARQQRPVRAVQIPSAHAE